MKTARHNWLLKRFSKALSLCRELCLLYRYTDGLWFLLCGGLNHFLTKGEGTYVWKKTLVKSRKSLFSSQIIMPLQICSRTYRTVKCLLISHTEGKMFKKRPAICWCLHVNICDLIWPRVVFQWYKWRNSCVEHESEVIPVISEILYSVMHSCQIRLLEQSSDKFSGKQLTVIHNTIVFGLLA